MRHLKPDVAAVNEAGTDYRNIPLGETSGVRISLNVFSKYAKIPGHVHPAHDQILYLVSGSLKAHCCGNTIEVSENEVFVVEKGEEHWFETEARGCTALSLLAGTISSETILTTLSERVLPLFELPVEELVGSEILVDPMNAAKRAGLSGHDAWSVEWVAKNICAGISRSLLDGNADGIDSGTSMS